jgi:hypothetical protein
VGGAGAFGGAGRARRSLVGSDRGRELTFVESVKSELGSKALHRAVEHIDGAYMLREESGAYDCDLASESEPLRLKTLSSGTKLSKLQRHSVV